MDAWTARWGRKSWLDGSGQRDLMGLSLPNSYRQVEHDRGHLVCRYFQTGDDQYIQGRSYNQEGPEQAGGIGQEDPHKIQNGQIRSHI